jgi:hypothetical protein
LGHKGGEMNFVDFNKPCNLARITIIFLIALSMALFLAPPRPVSADAVNPFIESQTAVEFFNQPGNYDFTQTNSSCTAIGNGCGSNTPITGFNVTSVPEPSTILGSLIFGAFLVLKRNVKVK